MVRPLKGGSHKKKYLLVMVDKFTKWIEAKPVKTAESGPVIDFISVLPCDIIHDSPRVCMYEEKEAELDRQDN